MNTARGTEANQAAWDKIGRDLPSPQLSCLAFIQSLEHFISLMPANGQVLDLGCGLGAVARLLVARGLNVTGVDYAESMVAGARAAVPGATFVRQSMLDINFDSEFDGVVASYSLLGLSPDEFAVVAGRIVRALRRGGVFLVALNEPEPGEDQDATAVSHIGGHMMYARAYSDAEVRQAFSGLAVVRVERGIVTSEIYGAEKGLFMIMAKE